jgi:hypothetical protein
MVVEVWMSTGTLNAAANGLRKLLPHTERNIHAKTIADVVLQPGLVIAKPYRDPVDLERSNPDFSRLNFEPATVPHDKVVPPGNAVAAEERLAELDQPFLLSAKSGTKQVLHLSVLVLFVLAGKISHDADRLMNLKGCIGLPPRKRDCAVI